jgi:2-methylcitrate dehydratase PrpD
MVRAMATSTRLAEFAATLALESCPPSSIAAVRRAALDSLGVMLAGAREPVAEIVRGILRTEGGAPLCTVFGSSLRTHPTGAALANGAAGHAHDFDDTNFTLMGHPSVPLLAAALAAAEAAMADGRRVVAGYLAGFEVSAALGVAVNPAHYERGWHATSSIGTIGCTAAAARVMELDVPTTRTALGIAASLASGLKENFGSMTKPFHAGHAARNGVWAATLAREGMSASDTALDGKQGWFAAFGAAAGLDAALGGLGQRWQLLESGIAVKPYPSCALTHATIDALIELRREHRLDADHVAQVEVGVTRVVPDVLIHRHPVTALQRKFSMEFCAAAALAEGRVDLATFEESHHQGAAVEKLMPRVAMVVDPSLPHEREQHAWSRVTVRLTDGRVLVSPPRGARGHPEQPLSREALRTKFFACAERVLSLDEAEGVAAELEHLEDIPDIRGLTARLAATAD